MTGPLHRRLARTLQRALPAALLIAMATSAFAGPTATVQTPVAQTQPPAAQQLVRCQGAITQCLSRCRSHNRQADRQCRAEHGALQFGSCKPDPDHCTCFATAPTCTPH